MKKFFIAGIAAIALASLTACASPESLGAEMAEATYKCEIKNETTACIKAIALQKRIGLLSDREQQIAAEAAILKALEMYSRFGR